MAYRFQARRLDIRSPFRTMAFLLMTAGILDDLTAAVRIVFERTFKEDVDARWDEVGEILDPKGHELRAWIAGLVSLGTI